MFLISPTYLFIYFLKLSVHGNSSQFCLFLIKESRPSTCGKQKFQRQRCLLMEKLDNFRKINKSVRQILKQLQNSEVGCQNISQNCCRHIYKHCQCVDGNSRRFLYVSCSLLELIPSSNIKVIFYRVRWQRLRVKMR